VTCATACWPTTLFNTFGQTVTFIWRCSVVESHQCVFVTNDLDHSPCLNFIKSRKKLCMAIYTASNGDHIVQQRCSQQYLTTEKSGIGLSWAGFGVSFSLHISSFDQLLHLAASSNSFFCVNSLFRRWVWYSLPYWITHLDSVGFTPEYLGKAKILIEVKPREAEGIPIILSCCRQITGSPCNIRDSA